MSRTDAVVALYQDMAARHRSRFRSIHVCPSRSRANRITYKLYRSSRSSSSRRLPTSSAHTSSNSSPRTSDSLFLTVSPRQPAASFSSASDHQLSTRRFIWVMGVWSVGVEQDRLHGTVDVILGLRCVWTGYDLSKTFHKWKPC